MRASRRAILAGSAASLVASRIKPAEAWLHPGVTSNIPTASMMYFDGGGFAFGITPSIDSNGNTILLSRNDEPGAFRFDGGTNLWSNISTNTAISGSTPGATGAAWDFAFGAHSSGTTPRVYMCFPLLPAVLGGGARPSPKYAVYRSDDGGKTWTITALQAVSGGASNKPTGPRMSVDPNNPDICYLMSYTGAVYVTYNGGSNWSRVSALLSAFIYSSTAAANSVPGSTSLTVAANPISGLAGYTAYDATAELALGTNTLTDKLVTSTTTTFSLYGQIQGRTSNSDTNGVEIGDTIYFALGGSLVIDGSSGTVANPGIALGVPGASGLASKIVYFAWGAGTNSLWWTQDGGSTFAAMPAGGPAGIGGLGNSNDTSGKMRLSNDSALTGGGNNVLYLGDGSTNGWRFVSTPPLGSGLAANTWTALSGFLPAGQKYYYPAPDPFTAGRIVFGDYRQGIAISLDYGNTQHAVQTAQTTLSGSSGTDCPWLATCPGYELGDVVFDLVTQNKLWVATGTGIFYTMVPTTAGNLNITFYSQTKGNQSMIPSKIVKTPSPNGRVLLACQDRPYFSIDGPTISPTTYYPNSGIGGGVSNGNTIAFSDSDPNTIWGAAVHLYKSTTGKVDDFVQLTIPTLSTTLLEVASTTPLSAVIIPNPNTDHSYYTTDGGTTWNICLYLGSPLVVTGMHTYGSWFHHLITDGIGNYYIFDTTTTNNTGAPAIFKSVDGGANWTLVSNPVLSTPYGVSGGIVAVPGFNSPQHFLVAPGYSGANYFTQNYPLQYSTDGGLTFSSVPGTYFAGSVDCGKAAPGKTYPAVFYFGRDTLGNVGVFRCDDITVGSPTWVYYDTGVASCDEGRGGVAADREVYGTFFWGTAGAGTGWGRLT